MSERNSDGIAAKLPMPSSIKNMHYGQPSPNTFEKKIIAGISHFMHSCGPKKEKGNYLNIGFG